MSESVRTRNPFVWIEDEHLKKRNGKFQRCPKIKESISLKAFEHRNRFSLLENNQEEDLVIQTLNTLGILVFRDEFPSML